MVVPINIPLATDTKLFNNVKPVSRNTKIVLKKKARPAIRSQKRPCLILSLTAFTVICLFMTVLYFNPLSYEPWYKTATLYHVDVRTFQDSDGDGIGDLKGLISKVEYLERQNIKALMLSSFYKSENDGIINHKDVCHTCGVMDDFRELIKQLKKKGIRLIIDFYPNHTSDKHPWFTASIKGLKSYDDYYIWSDSASDDERKPPNNWLNIHGESAWTWNEERKQFYLGTFGKHLPDLNLRNRLVRNELKDIIIYWMEEDVDGFNVVAASHLVENSYLFNEPVLTLNKAKNLQYEDIDHIFTIDQYENLDLFAEWKKIINNFSKKKILIAEVSGSFPKGRMYYGNETFPLATLVYNSEFTQINENVTGTKLKWYFASSIDDVPSYGWPAWMIGSKTKPRLESRVGDLLDGIHMIFMLAKGTPITYSGDEFGISSLPNEDNVQMSMKRESHLSIFRKLLELRNHYVIIYGIQQYPIVTDQVFSLLRCHDSKGFLVAVNLSNDPITLDFTGTSPRLPSKATLVLQSGHFVNSSLSNKEQQKVSLNNIYLGPKHAALFSFGPSVNVRDKKKKPKM